MMQTVDIHTHLLSPEVQFNRLFDRLSIPLFARGLGVDPRTLARDPYNTYVEAMANAVTHSRHVAKSCLFGVDARLDERGREIHRDATVCATTNDVLEVAGRYPGSFIPFLSINPLREDAIERIDAAVEAGCRGAKFLQNYWGIDLNDEQFIPYYERLVHHNLPLIIHIGSEYSIDSFAAYERVEMLDLPLSSGVTVIAAHMGLGRVTYKWRAWRNLSRNPHFFDHDYYRLIELLRDRPNLYADISAILAPLRARALRHLSEQYDIHHKLLFGTDYPVPFTVGINSYDLPRERRRHIARTTNPFDRYAEVILEYFPAENPIYSNYQKILNAEADR